MQPLSLVALSAGSNSTPVVSKNEGFMRLLFDICAALIIGSATLNALLHRAKRPKHPNHKAFDKLDVYSKLPKVADAVIEARETIARRWALDKQDQRTEGTRLIL